MTVSNKEGEFRNVVFRLARPGDVPRIISLLKKQHGAGYYPKMYDEAYVRESMEKDTVRIILAETEDGAIAGVIGSTTDTPFPGASFSIMLTVVPALRGFGLAKQLHGFLAQSIPSNAYSCNYGHCVTLDTRSQRNLIGFGYQMTGLLPNGYFNDATAEYLAGLSLPVKDVLVVACLPLAKKDAGLLYSPPAYREYIAGVYRSLGVSFSLEESGGALPASSAYSLTDITEHRYCELIAHKTGDDFKDILRNMLQRYGGLENQTFTVFLNLNDPACPTACRLLEELGFFFAGVHPLSGRHEYMLMHYSPSLPVPFDRIVVVPEFKERCEHIRHFYREASHGRAD
jgi:hypothetical protein